MINELEYGNALYELASENGQEEEIKEEFEKVSEILEQNKEFMNLLSNPRIPTWERLKVVDTIFGNNNIKTYLLSVIKIFTENREAFLLPKCYECFLNKYYEEKNIMLVTAISAIELEDVQKQRITKHLEQSIGKRILLENKIDKACIGGIVLKYRGHMIDASIENRFKKLRQAIISADYSYGEV